MPELPEVEVTRQSVAGQIVGGTIQSIHLGKPLRWPLQTDPLSLVGKTIVSVGRRGKYLLFHLDAGCLLVHLGMSGSLRFARQLPEAGPHDHFTLVTQQGSIRLHDPRRFGAVVYAPGVDHPPATQLLAGLGVEPLSPDFDQTRFVKAMRGKRTSVKQALLAGKVVVGVGNIYASEVLYLAGIHPATRADRVTQSRLRQLHAAIRLVLQEAVAAGGSTLRDFSAPDGSAGHFQTMTKVYGRAGLPCLACGQPVTRFLQGQRATYCCANCQRG